MVEMLNAGVTVGLGSDGPAPDRSGDPFVTARSAMQHQRERYSSHEFLPPGKAMEMITVDGQKALGNESTLGSLTPGKRADLVVIDLYSPHLWPTVTPVQQVAYFATGADVRHVFVDGRQVVRDNRLVCVDTDALLDEAQDELERLLRIAQLGLRDLVAVDPGFGQAQRGVAGGRLPRSRS